MNAIKESSDRSTALKLLVRAQSDAMKAVSARLLSVEADRPNTFLYYSPSRPFWYGFDADVTRDEAGASQYGSPRFLGYHDDLHVVETSRELTLDEMSRWGGLVPINQRALVALATPIMMGFPNKQMSYAFARPDEQYALMLPADQSSPAYSTIQVDSRGDTPAVDDRATFESGVDALLRLTAVGYGREVPLRYVGDAMGFDVEAERFAREYGRIRGGFATGWGEDRIAASETYLKAVCERLPDVARETALRFTENPSAYVEISGLPPARIDALSQQLRGLPPPAPAVGSAPVVEPEPSMPTRSWPDLSSQGYYLGNEKLVDGQYRLILLDMQDRAKETALAVLGFKPLLGSPRFAKGVYYYDVDAPLRPQQLAQTLGFTTCPMAAATAEDIARVFRQKLEEKSTQNIHVLMQHSKPLGLNAAGLGVFESAAGRFVRQSENQVVLDDSLQAAKRGPAFFLRAPNESALRQCADGFLWSIRNGEKTTWRDLVQLGRTVWADQLGRDDQGKIEKPSDAQLHRLQEAVEASAYRVFSEVATGLNEATFMTAQNYYYGLPAARVRTGQSVYLEQYSTPLPLAVIAQRLLVGQDDMTGKTVLEPTAGNAGLVSLLPEGAQAYAVELDPQRAQALSELPRVTPHVGDAVTTNFKTVFGQKKGFDYTISNPPFSSLPSPIRFDKLPKVTRLDHYIPLRALEARKAEGRSVVIFGADSNQSDGTLSRKAKQTLQYLMDHYEIEALTEVDGRLYARQGAGFNVRVLVVGAQRPEPILGVVPDRLPIITSYPELWDWSSQVLATYGQDAVLRAEQSRISPADELIAEPDDALEASDEAAVLMPDTILQVDALPMVDSPDEVFLADARTDDILNGGWGQVEASPTEGLSPPWKMDRTTWYATINEAREAVLTGGEDPLSRLENIRAFLNYGVSDWATERVQAHERGEVKLTVAELAEATERLQTSVSHRDVIEKALGEGKIVPSRVLADYPDLAPPETRLVNTFQTPYQPASQAGEPSTMIPINMAGATYAALNRLESEYGKVDQFVAQKLQYPLDSLGRYFSVEQIDALALAVKAVEEGRGIINGDQTGVGKGRWVAGMLRYGKLSGRMPVFVTIKPELFTDIFRDLGDIGSADLFKKVFIFNDGERVAQFGDSTKTLFPATRPEARRAAIASGKVPDDTDLILSTYSQFSREASVSPKARLFAELCANRGMLLLDEAHTAAGDSNTSVNIGRGVDSADGVLYASATALKSVESFNIYRKIFPASVDLSTLGKTLKDGGEALQEAISANMARDGVIIRREHDFSKLTFNTRLPDEAREAAIFENADQLSEILSGMCFLAGDVGKQVADMNNGYKADWEKKQAWQEVSAEDRQGNRMQALAFNFGSRHYAVNRQHLLGIKIDEAVACAIEDLENGRKPVFAVENTGESLTRQVISRRLGLDALESELSAIDAQDEALTAEQIERRAVLVERLSTAMRSAELDTLPQFRELLDIMLDRIGQIKIIGRYGEAEIVEPTSEGYHENVARLRALIADFPDMPLTPLDVISARLTEKGYTMGEVSGRGLCLKPITEGPRKGGWRVELTPNRDAGLEVERFQNGTYDCIAITRAGSTGISLHATDRFENSDTRQRNFIVLQKASNIADFLQWLGRVNRKDQVCAPIITTIESGLPSELRLTMMHNCKLRKLSANTSCNRDSANMADLECDWLNWVGDNVAMEYLLENPDLADHLNIKMPDLDDLGRPTDDFYYINALLQKLGMAHSVKNQFAILDTLQVRFQERIDELTQRGQNPFSVDVYDWNARIEGEEELQSGVLNPSGSSFDEPVKLVKLAYEKDVYPMRADDVRTRVGAGLSAFMATDHVDEKRTLSPLTARLAAQEEAFVRSHLPMKLREEEGSVAAILKAFPDAIGAKHAQERATWLRENVAWFGPGSRITLNDPIRGEIEGVVLNVTFPTAADQLFVLSSYRGQVAFIGEPSPREVNLSTLRSQEKNLRQDAWFRIDPEVNRENSVTPYGQRRAATALLDAFDSEPQGQVTRTQYVLMGNLFRACELAATQSLGYPMLFTDAEGNRQRAVMLRDRISPEMVKSLPLGFDAEDMSDYVRVYFDPQNPMSRERSSAAFRCFNRGVKAYTAGEDIMLMRSSRGEWTLSMPGSKSRAGALMTDPDIIDIGSKSSEGSLKLSLSGNRTEMTAPVPAHQVSELMRRLQDKGHLGKFYVPVPDQPTLVQLKTEHAQARLAAREALKTASSGDVVLNSDEGLTAGLGR